MANKNRIIAIFKSTESKHRYQVSIKKSNSDLTEMKKHDPIINKHVLYRKVKK